MRDTAPRILEDVSSLETQLNVYGFTEAAWRALSPAEKNRAYKRKWSKANIPKTTARMRLYHIKRLKEDPEYRNQVNERRRSWYARNKEVNRGYYYKKIEKNPNYIADKNRRRLERDPEYEKKKRARKTERDPDWARKKYKLQKERDPDINRKSYARQKSKMMFLRNPQAILARVYKAIPRTLQGDARDDLAGDMCVALAQGSLLIKDIEKEVAKFVTAHNRANDPFKTLSLDAEMPGTQKRYIDDVAADTPHF